MADISGVGTQGSIKFSKTFPNGIQLSQFAHDADPLDIPAIKIAEAAMSLNGAQVYWSKAAPIIVTINVIPNSDEDKSLALAAEANRVGRGKLSVGDIIDLAVSYPDGKVKTLKNGIMTDFMPANSVASGSNLKSKPYTFSFEGYAST